MDTTISVRLNPCSVSICRHRNKKEFCNDLKNFCFERTLNEQYTTLDCVWVRNDCHWQTLSKHTHTTPTRILVKVSTYSTISSPTHWTDPNGDFILSLFRYLIPRTLRLKEELEFCRRVEETVRNHESKDFLLLGLNLIHPVVLSTRPLPSNLTVYKTVVTKSLSRYARRSRCRGRGYFTWTRKNNHRELALWFVPWLGGINNSSLSTFGFWWFPYRKGVHSITPQDSNWTSTTDGGLVSPFDSFLVGYKWLFYIMSSYKQKIFWRMGYVNHLSQ